MCSIPRVCRTMKQLFEQEAPVLARQGGLRERTIPFASLIYILVLGWWKDPKAGPSALARFANSLGVTACKQDVGQSFYRADSQRSAGRLAACGPGPGMRRAGEAAPVAAVSCGPGRRWQFHQSALGAQVRLAWLWRQPGDSQPAGQE